MLPNGGATFTVAFLASTDYGWSTGTWLPAPMKDWAISLPGDSEGLVGVYGEADEALIEWSWLKQ